jgi:osmotically-inducible protein OsmY
VNAKVITTSETNTDARLRHTVEEELASEPSVDAAAIGVALKDGVVTLSGHVASHAEKVAAENAAARVFGVRAIVTELEVKLPGSIRLRDEEIARAAVDALSWNTVVPADRIKVRVERGWITLAGDVDWGYQKSAAYNAVAYLKGVRGVSNKIALKPASISTSVHAHIEAALQRSFGRRKSPVTVEASGDHVTLRGEVASLAEREAIERAAWTTPGVCHVNNNLSVAARRRRPPLVHSVLGRGRGARR